MVTGKMATSTIIHGGKFAKVKEGIKLYEPLCSKMQAYRSLTYLLDTHLGQPITCKKCTAKYAKHQAFYDKQG